MGDPEQPDHGEAEGEPADLGEGVSELLARLQVGHVGDLKIDDQQGDGDGEDGVAEEQHPVVLDLLGPGQGTPAVGAVRHGPECTPEAGGPLRCGPDRETGSGRYGQVHHREGGG
jgi:hypothetical protein